MANTYTQIHIQCVMAVKFRDALIELAWKDKLHNILRVLFKTTDIK